MTALITSLLLAALIIAAVCGSWRPMPWATARARAAQWVFAIGEAAARAERLDNVRARARAAQHYRGTL